MGLTFIINLMTTALNIILAFKLYIKYISPHGHSILEAFHHNICAASITPENAIIMNLPEIDFEQNYKHIYLCV